MFNLFLFHLDFLSLFIGGIGGLILGIFIYAMFNSSDFKKALYSAMLAAKNLALQGKLVTGKDQEDWIINNIIKILGGRWLWLVGIIGEDKLRVIIATLYQSAIATSIQATINIAASDPSGGGVVIPSKVPEEDVAKVDNFANSQNITETAPIITETPIIITETTQNVAVEVISDYAASHKGDL